MNSTRTERQRAAHMEGVAAPISVAAVERPNALTREARRYAIGEVVSRAGVSAAWSKTWRIEISDQSATIHLDSTGKKRIVFPVDHAPNGTPHSIVSGKTSRAAWAYPPGANLRDSVPDFVLPFVGRSQTGGISPVFAASDRETIRFNFDLPAATLFTLARVEETVISERDSHGRFPASASIAVKEDFLHRPIVDEYGFALEQALQCLMPQWSAERKPLRVKLSHDVDVIGIPFSLRSTVGHTFQRRSPRATIQDFLSLVTKRKPVYLESLSQFAKLSTDHALDSAFYWKASAAGKNDSGYDLGNAKVTSTLCWLKERGFESGVHPGYETFHSQQKLRDEVDKLRQCIGNDELGGRQHYLRWLPETWRHWEACGLAYDSSVGFADRIGFRAGTCLPYRPWLWEENREANLLEIPLLVMDRTLAYYMKLSPQESFLRVLNCLERCRAVGGVFTMLWHNEALLDPVYGDLYSRLLKCLSGAARFDWRAKN
jgi:hypothetical protein